MMMKLLVMMTLAMMMVMIGIEVIASNKVKRDKLLSLLSTFVNLTAMMMRMMMVTVLTTAMVMMLTTMMMMMIMMHKDYTDINHSAVIMMMSCGEVEA